MNKDKFWEDLRSGTIAAMIKESAPGRALTSAQEAYNILKPVFAEEDDVEKMMFIFLNQQNEILSIEPVSKGTIAGAAVYPREIVKRILKLKANAVIMAHNHPSGGLKPSPEDKVMTLRVIIALRAIDVTVHDHIIVGNEGRYYSMGDEGVIGRIKQQIRLFLEDAAH